MAHWNNPQGWLGMTVAVLLLAACGPKNAGGGPGA